MPKAISPELINEIQDRCDIVELISSYFPLKKAGRNFRTTCPFHNEKTPSFIVSPDKQIFHCFGCGEGGNALSFLMKYERLDFKEALKTLADRVGVTLKFQETSSDRQVSYISELYRIMEIASSFYQDLLIKSVDPKVKKYLESRNLKPETIKRINLGVAPNQWDSLLNFLRSKGINIKLIEKAGLIIPKDNGGYYDRFRNRLIIPIHDVKNRVIAFGARVLDDSLPKYINSPETPIYTKGKNLFGLNLAKEAIGQNDYVVIVEGYFDVISPMEKGLSNMVSSSGTALTTEQIRLLKRYTLNAIVIFDSDAAGQLATLRSLELFLEEDMNVKVVDLPRGYDPDSFVKTFGIEKFKTLIIASLDIFNYKFKVLSSLYDAKKIEEKTKIAIQMLSMIKKIKNDILKSEYIKLLAEKISINENSLIKELDKIKTYTTNYAWSNQFKKSTNHAFPKSERMLIKLVIEDLRVVEDIKNFLNSGDLQDERLQRILELAIELYDSHKQLKPYQIISYIQDEEFKNLISELTNEETLTYEPESRNDILQDCIKRIKSNSINLRCKDIQTEIKHAQSEGDANNMNKLKKEFNLLIQMRKKGILNEKTGN